MEIKITQRKKPTYNRNLATEDYITAQLADAVDKRVKSGTLSGKQGFVSLWFRADKATSTIRANGALMFPDRTTAEDDFQVNKLIFGIKRDSLYIYAVGAYFVIEDAEDNYIVRAVLLHAEGLETF